MWTATSPRSRGVFPTPSTSRRSTPPPCSKPRGCCCPGSSRGHRQICKPGNSPQERSARSQPGALKREVPIRCCFATSKAARGRGSCALGEKVTPRLAPYCTLAPPWCPRRAVVRERREWVSCFVGCSDFTSSTRGYSCVQRRPVSSATLRPKNEAPHDAQPVVRHPNLLLPSRGVNSWRPI